MRLQLIRLPELSRQRGAKDAEKFNLDTTNLCLPRWNGTRSTITCQLRGATCATSWVYELLPVRQEWIELPSGDVMLILDLEDEMPYGKYKGWLVAAMLSEDADYAIWFAETVDDVEFTDEILEALHVPLLLDELLQQ